MIKIMNDDENNDLIKYFVVICINTLNTKYIRIQYM